jgi:hypothetical protein
MTTDNVRALAAILCLWLPLVAGSAGAQCFQLGGGSEEVCVSGVSPGNHIQVGPGDQVRLLVEFVNHTNREMTFTIEVVGGSVFTSGNFFATLAPGQASQIGNILLLETDDRAPIGTQEEIVIRWEASGSLPGVPDFFVRFDKLVDFQVGPDSDGDGLVDGWETNGYDPDDDGQIDVDLPALGADPLHKDLFVEIDWEEGREPIRAELQEVRSAFAAAPIDAGGVANPDGLPGITVHFDTGTLTDESGELVGDPEFADGSGGGTWLPPFNWTFVRTCFGGPDSGLSCHPVHDPCDQSWGPGTGLCEEGIYLARNHGLFNPNRRFIFRYAIYNDVADPPTAAAQAELGKGNIWLVSRRAQVLMHEIGHTLNLSHAGPPEEDKGDRNCEPNYLSTMNYRYGRIRFLDGSSIIDFSPPRLSGGGRPQRLGDLDEASLLEEALDPSDSEHYITFTGPQRICRSVCNAGAKKGLRCIDNGDCEDKTCAGLDQDGADCSSDSQCDGGVCAGTTLTSVLDQPIDWNANFTVGEVVSQNIDGNNDIDSSCQRPDLVAERGELTGYDDWSNVRLRFDVSDLGQTGSAAGPYPEPNWTEETIRESLEHASTADLAIEKRGPLGPLEAETPATLSYELVVSNSGPTLAGAVRVRDEVPGGFSVKSLDERCQEPEAGIVECEIHAFMSGDETSLQVEIEGVPSCQGSLPAAVRNVASVENVSDFAGDDPFPADNEAALETGVQDTTAPQLEVEVSPTTLWAPDHTLREISVSLSASDACDDEPMIRLVSVESSEPDNGTGDGNMEHDIQGVDLGTADTSLLLRAERAGNGVDRIYTLTYQAEDASGNLATVSKTVTVPRGSNRRPGSDETGS